MAVQGKEDFLPPFKQHRALTFALHRHVLAQGKQAVGLIGACAALGVAQIGFRHQLQGQVDQLSGVGKSLALLLEVLRKSLLQVVAFKSSLPSVPACVQLNAWGGAFSALYVVTADEAEEIASQLRAAAGRVRSMNAGLGGRRAA